MSASAAAFPDEPRDGLSQGRERLARRSLEFLATGGATFLLVPLFLVVRLGLGMDEATLAVSALFFYAGYVVNDPHFTVTYVLFYEDARRRAFGDAFSRGQRIRWWLAGVVVPVALVSWSAFAIAARSAAMLGGMIQAMFLLVGWHYVKQGFGVLTVLSARRGVRLDRTERIAILAHCFAGWAFAWANPTTAAGEYEEKGIVYWQIAHPRWLELVTGGIFALTTIAFVGVLVLRKIRTGRFLPLAPLAGLVVTIWSWTIFTSADPLLRYAIPALHSVQYFYFVWLLRRNEARAFEGPPHFGRPAAVRLLVLGASALGLGFLLFRGIPTFLDDALAARWRHEPTAETMGTTPFFAAFFVVVNIHHYFMDAVLWRRENPGSRWLTSDVEPARAPRASAEA